MISALESLLFISGDEGLKLEDLKKILELSSEDILDIINKLNEEYKNQDRGIELIYLGNRLKLVTKKENKKFIQKMVNVSSNEKLSESALETLAIIAYNQPITRINIDEIRGVSSAYLIRKLVCKNLVCEMGRSEIAGRPILYGTTQNFLDYFGLKSLSDLPKIKVIENDDVAELYSSKYNEEN